MAEPLATSRELTLSHLHLLSTDGLIRLDAAPLAKTSGNEWITVVAGLPRSGTSMLMQMLHAGGMPVLNDEHWPADIDNPRGYCEYKPARNLHRDRQWLAQAQGHAVKIVVQLLPRLPADQVYRILLIQRDMEEVLTSQQAMLDRLSPGKRQRSRALLAHEYSRQVRSVRGWLQSQGNIQTLLLSYHEVLARPGPAADAINRFLGGRLDVRAMAAAVDAALHRQKSDQSAVTSPRATSVEPA